MAPIAVRSSASAGPPTAQSLAAAFIVASFDTIDQMHAVYNCHRGHTALSVDGSAWRPVQSIMRKAFGQTKTPVDLIRAI